MEPLPPEDFTAYSEKDLQDLMRITQQTLDHYSRILHNSTVNAGYKHSVYYCYQQTEIDLEDVKKEIERRKRPVLMSSAQAPPAEDVKIEVQESPFTQGPGTTPFIQGPNESRHLAGEKQAEQSSEPNAEHNGSS